MTACGNHKSIYIKNIYVEVSVWALREPIITIVSDDLCFGLLYPAHGSQCMHIQYLFEV